MDIIIEKSSSIEHASSKFTKRNVHYAEQSFTNFLVRKTGDENTRSTLLTNLQAQLTKIDTYSTFEYFLKR